MSDASTAAIEFALKLGAGDCGLEFLRCWRDGEFGSIREEWPEAPEEVFVGADPLHPSTKKRELTMLDLNKEIERIMERLVDSEEHATDSAIPQVALDANDLLAKIQNELN
ncbi:hypothetical protein [Ectothiorhodospira shaposhnikovii]|uniref:hypothetical protein n=1 Tax=Ectothiorhodospira shaposhnikovii TaxID=1054 RepID=UPI001EE8BC0B|nr:hypothetical protein [Ectothiorhodospira shaposhnikovii]MCG5512806.1 hypothetical protein [Ectothiorhodospira shaposhnikovii]